jgi:hypothetical protein
MRRATRRRAYLRQLGASGGVGGLASASAEDADRDATADWHAGEGAEPAPEAPDGESTVASESTFAPRTERSMRATSTGGDLLLFVHDVATGGGSSEFPVAIDSGAQRPGETVERTVSHDGEALDGSDDARDVGEAPPTDSTDGTDAEAGGDGETTSGTGAPGFDILSPGAGLADALRRLRDER